MPRRKSFTAPLWLLAPTICVQAYFLYVLIGIFLTDYQEARERPKTDDQYPAPSLSFTPITIETGIIVFVLIAEAVILWRVRRRKYYKALAWLYAFFMLLVLVILPFWAFTIDSLYLIKPHIPLYWILTGAGHLCFVLLVLQTYFRQPVFAPTDPDNILDDYAE